MFSFCTYRVHIVKLFTIKVVSYQIEHLSFVVNVVKDKMLTPKNLFLLFGAILIIVNNVYSCKCIAPKDGDEVCGSDGKTYASNCVLFCEGLYRDQSEPCLTKVADQQCNSPECVCTDPCSYVCGSNNHTYGNECTLKCAQQHHSNLEKLKDGKCN